MSCAAGFSGDKFQALDQVVTSMRATIRSLVEDFERFSHVLSYASAVIVGAGIGSFLASFDLAVRKSMSYTDRFAIIQAVGKLT